MQILDYMEKYDYENLYFCQDKATGLKAVIALHDTLLGPAVGGCRMWTYEREEDAIEDALRLARGMTYKYAAAGINLGGGKAVIIGDPKKQKSEALFRALGRFINILNGRYITGEDVGTTLEDMEYIHMETPHVVTLPEYLGGAGPISFYTALGTVQALKAAHNHLYSTDDLAGKRVAIQGIGSVGYHVAELLAKEGAKLCITDIDMEKAKEVAKEFGAEVVGPDRIFSVECDILSPCALGAIINDETIPLLKCKLVAGCANNQLKESRHGDILEEKGIFYVPDYISNAGGTVYDTDRLMYGQHNKERATKNVMRIYQTMQKVIQIAKEQNIPTYQAADRYAEFRINEIRKVKNI